jgi:5'-nucleotidase
MANHNHSAAARVLILHTNDVHSRLEQAARIATYIEEERHAQGEDRLLLLDVGDHMDRMRLETEGSDGIANIRLMNAAGYDAVTLGNNEGLTCTAGMLERAYGQEARFSVLCANMVRSNTGLRPEWMQPCKIIEKSGLRFGIIGVTAAFAEFYEILGWQMIDPVAAVAEWTAELRPNADVIVVLSHLGLQLDKRMAEEIEGIDLILGGHTHHLLEEPLIMNGTTICAAGKFGEYVGRIEIGMDEAAQVPVIRAACVPMAASPEQEEAMALIGSFRASAVSRLSRVVAYLSEQLPLSTDRESPLANLLAAGIRRHTDAEIGLVNAGQLLAGLPAGEVTEATLHALCPSPINPCRMKLAGSRIRQALEESLLQEWINKAIRGYGFRGLILGTLAVDGLEIHYEPEAPAYHRLVSVDVNGMPLDDEREYVVGTIDMFTFGVGYESIKLGSDIRYYLPEFIRDVLAGELRRADSDGVIAAAHASRWQTAWN